MSVFIAIAGLLVLVAVHELGHFTAAKLTGMRIDVKSETELEDQRQEAEID